MSNKDKFIALKKEYTAICKELDSLDFYAVDSPIESKFLDIDKIYQEKLELHKRLELVRERWNRLSVTESIENYKVPEVNTDWEDKK